MADSTHAVYYFPAIEITASKNNLTGGYALFEYPKKNDVAIRYNNVFYTGYSVQLVKYTNTYYLVYHAINADGTYNYYLAISLKTDNNAPNNSINNLVSLLTSETPSTIVLDLESVYNGLGNPVSKKNVSGNTVLTIINASIGINSLNLSKITQTSSSIPFDVSKNVQLTFTRGEPKMEMDCTHKGDDMENKSVTKKNMSDKDIMHMVSTNLIVFIAIIAGYSTMFPHLYKFGVIDVAKHLGNGTDYLFSFPKWYWATTLVVYSVIVLIYGMRNNNSSFITAGFFMFVLLGLSSFLKSTNTEINKITENMSEASFSISGFKGMSLIGLVFSIVCFLAFGITSFVFAVKKNESVFIGVSTAFIVSVVIGYCFIMVGAHA